MVKKLSTLLILLTIAFPAFASAASFTATVDRSSVAVGESFTLQLTLSDAQAKDAPDMGPLNKSFIVTSQGQTANTTIINGKVNASVGWELTLIPQTQGQLTIPALSVETDSGTLSTQPITIEVGKASALPAKSRSGRTTITASASKMNPYKGQPVFYTVKIIARDNVADLTLGDLAMDNAIVQPQGKPKIYDRVENGAPVKIVELHYIITPLDAGKITIPSLLLQGKMVSAQRNPFNNFNNAFSDPFGMLSQMDAMGGFASYKPFSLASNEVPLDVKPAAVAMDPWLPLTSLRIEESLEAAQEARVGEPVTRKITLVADGAVGKQLPSLESQQNHADFKVYADKPVTEENIKGETIIGTRKESYSLIPLKAGKLVLPEIRIPWWDITNNHIAYASLPPRTLEILPALAAQGQAPSAVTAQPVPAQQRQAPSPPFPPQSTVQQVPVRFSVFSYIIISILALVLLMALLWAARLQRKVSALNESGERNVQLEPAITLAKRHTVDLATVRTAQELANFVREYAHEHWAAPQNAPLEVIFSEMPMPDDSQKAAADRFVRNLTVALYAGKEADLEKLKEQCNAIIGAVKRAGNDNVRLPEKLPKLNPT